MKPKITKGPLIATGLIIGVITALVLVNIIFSDSTGTVSYLGLGLILLGVIFYLRDVMKYLKQKNEPEK